MAAAPRGGPFYRAWVDRVQHHFAHDDQHTIKLRERRKKQVRNLKQCCKRFFAFLFSHIGLSALLVGYTSIGGLMFLAIEGEQEKIRNEEIQQEINSTKSELLSVILNSKNKSDVRMKIDNFLHNYTQFVLSAVIDKGWRGKNETNWSFSGSILYAVTVITTIGKLHRKRKH